MSLIILSYLPLRFSLRCTHKPKSKLHEVPWCGSYSPSPASAWLGFTIVLRLALTYPIFSSGCVDWNLCIVPPSHARRAVSPPPSYSQQRFLFFHRVPIISSCYAMVICLQYGEVRTAIRIHCDCLFNFPTIYTIFRARCLFDEIE